MAEQIVVGVDGSASALHATRWAATEAALRGARLRLVYVRELQVLLPPTDLYAAKLTDQGMACLAAAQTEARAIAPSVDVHTELRTGRATEELVDEAANAGMVVVGSRGLGGFRSLLLGSVANALTALGSCPIVVMRGRTAEVAPPDSGPVVVGADGTPASTSAVEFALTVAAARNADVLAVHAWTYDNLAEGWSTPSTVVRWDDIAIAQHRVFEKQLSEICASHPNVRVRSVHYWGHPADGNRGELRRRATGGRRRPQSPPPPLGRHRFDHERRPAPRDLSGGRGPTGAESLSAPTTARRCRRRDVRPAARTAGRRCAGRAAGRR